MALQIKVLPEIVTTIRMKMHYTKPKIINNEGIYRNKKNWDIHNYIRTLSKILYYSVSHSK